MKRYIYGGLALAAGLTVLNLLLNKVYESGYAMGRLANSIDAAADCREALSQYSCPKH